MKTPTPHAYAHTRRIRNTHVHMMSGNTHAHTHIHIHHVIYAAGLSSEEKLHGVKYIIESFVGCIRNVVLSSGKAASDLLPITPLVATKHENVNEGCADKCYSRHNLCFVGSRCINHYYDISCDCFGSQYEGEHCDIFSKYLSELLFFRFPKSKYP